LVRYVMASSSVRVGADRSIAASAISSGSSGEAVGCSRRRPRSCWVAGLVLRQGRTDAGRSRVQAAPQLDEDSAAAAAVGRADGACAFRRTQPAGRRAQQQAQHGTAMPAAGPECRGGKLRLLMAAG
jgi:hypothetical protein